MNISLKKVGTMINNFKASEKLFSKAKESLAGGISSSARDTSSGLTKHPIYIERGLGPNIWDLDGNKYIDYLLSYGSVILGHGDPGYIEAVTGQLMKGTMFGTCNTVEVDLAEQIKRMVPCAELVRYANSGSEAIAGAVRAARTFSGRNKILKFEGHYHGWTDILAVSNRPAQNESGPLESPNNLAHSLGIPEGVVSDVIICPWNQPEILIQILNRHSSEIGVVIAEPIVANNACIMPRPGFLEMLREECTRREIVLIFDEIVTGFRVAPGGAQDYFNVVPDIAVFSKAFGGGVPISAFAGRKWIMENVALNKSKHGGTYNGNPLCSAAALYNLQILAKKGTLDAIISSGRVLMEAIRRAAHDNGIKCHVNGVGSMFQVVFTEDENPPVHYRDLHRADMGRYAQLRNSLLKDGIYCNSSGLACWFLSLAHSADDIEATVSSIDNAFKSMV